jgi:hypothetical protein
LLYYVAAWDAPDGNAIRAGISYDGETFQPLSGGNVFLQHRVDPDVVRVDGGPGLRMYHTIWREGHPGWAEGSDPLTFEDMGALPNLQDNSYHPGQDPEPGDLALFDPSYLRLPDGTMVMYLGAWYTGHDGWTLSYVWRAVAMDGAAPAPRP